MNDLPKKENNQILLPQNFFSKLEYKHLLLDTSFFGDYAAYPDIFIDFVTKCRDHNITLVTIVPVVAEFTRGSETPDIYKKKTLLIKEIVGEHILPIHPNVFGKEVIKLVEEYGQTGKAVSITDYCLAAMTKIYKVDLCLLTKNPKDFPTSIFAVECYFLLQLNRALQVYGIYTFIDDSFASPEPEPPF